MIRLAKRIAALKVISERCRTVPLVLSCGATSREMAHVGRGDNHLYVVDSMGLVSSITLGLSLGLENTPIERCVGVDGDGGTLMNLNALATIGYLAPKKWLFVALDNESHASTGGQRSSAEKINLAAVAGSFGLNVWIAYTLEDLDSSLRSAMKVSGPGFIHMKVAKGNTDVPLLTDDPVALGNHFQDWIKKRIG